MGNKHSYHDYPEGTHCVYKTACVTKLTSLFGLYLATLDVVNYSKPANIGGALARYPQYMVPGVMTGVVFGMTCCTMSMLRGKDDSTNYFVAGGAMGSVFGMARRSFKVGTPCTFVMAIGCYLYKTYQDSQYGSMPRYPNRNGTWDSMAYDFTLVADRPKYTVDRPSFV